ncbi:MAG: type II toxin-antitoxin system RatA family toxin [Rhodospirillales bacterium]|nr:type II toxin-antitoxin system RatA family toxin [Rhodospirillales bacterium]MCB9973875.1 type II toxin-antitoxin system RatA family toxin [Rhodospirillales bacterium]
MPSHFEQKVLPYSCEQMFDLVADVGKYKEFTPWCIGSRIHKWEGEDTFYADLVIGYKLFRERFSSKVHLEPHERIHIEYLDGPLKHLRNEWRFIPECNGHCRIDFSVDFEFRNLLFQRLVNVFFTEVVRRMVSAFEKRAGDLYDSH